jgi:TolC family type I secretion outer membrane protein
VRLNIETEVAAPSQDATRHQLLEAAAEVFAEAGFHNATVREICRRAGANIAAINYHFGDKEKLYAEVIRSSHAKTLEKYPPLLGLAPDAPAEKRLRAFVHSLLLRIFDHGPTSCHGKLMLREMIEPTGAMDLLIEERIRPMSEQLWKIVGELLNRPADDVVVRQCAMSVVSQCVFYKHCAAFVSRLAPEQMPQNDAGVEILANHITEFSLAALKKFRKSKEFCPMKKLKMLFCTLAVIVAGNFAYAADTNSPAWLTRPLSLADALNTALLQNASILKAKNDFESEQGLVIQTRAVALPQVVASGQYQYTQTRAIESFPGTSQPNRNWSTGIQIVQTVYDGGKSIAALRSASTTKKQSLAIYQTAVEDTLLSVRLAYYDVLLAAQQVTVHEASVKLLQKELEDQQHRLDAGTVPKFNVLRAEVAVANERPNLIQAKNNYRISKNNLSNLLGYNLPREVWQDIPLNLIDGFDTAPLEVNLPDAIQSALTKRTELEAARRTVDLQKLNVTSARSVYQPAVSVFAGYDWFNAKFTPPVDLGHDIHGWDAGAQLSWAIFDGGLTYGKVKQARAQLDKSKTDLADQSRQIELQVRTAYSDFLQARETLDSQQKVQEEAEEALREANARQEAGTGTQLDVLDAETALTQARTTLVQSQHDYVSAVARYQRAIGSDLTPGK